MSLLIPLITVFVITTLVPVISILLNISPLNEIFNPTIIAIYSLLFVLGSLVSWGILSFVNKEKKKAPSEGDKNESLQENIQNLGNITLKEISISNIPANVTPIVPTPVKETSNNKPAFGNREYQPTNFATNNTPTSMLGVSVVTEGDKQSQVQDPVGTQVLFGSSSQNAFLIEFGSTSMVDRVYLDKPEFIIGRDKAKVHLTIEEKSISKQHAVIKTNNDSFYIEDYNSRNGTFINGERLKPHKDYQLTSGAEITFSNQRFKFHIE